MFDDNSFDVVLADRHACSTCATPRLCCSRDRARRAAWASLPSPTSRTGPIVWRCCAGACRSRAACPISGTTHPTSAWAPLQGLRSPGHQATSCRILDAFGLQDDRERARVAQCACAATAVFRISSGAEPGGPVSNIPCVIGGACTVDWIAKLKGRHQPLRRAGGPDRPHAPRSWSIVGAGCSAGGATPHAAQLPIACCCPASEAQQLIAHLSGASADCGQSTRWRRYPGEATLFVLPTRIEPDLGGSKRGVCGLWSPALCGAACSTASPASRWTAASRRLPRGVAASARARSRHPRQDAPKPSWVQAITWAALWRISRWPS